MKLTISQLFAAPLAALLAAPLAAQLGENEAVLGRGVAQTPVAPSSTSVGLPLAFVENRGQWDSPARFVARNGPLTAHFGL